MGKRVSWVCDCCGKDIESEEYFIKIKPSFICRGKSGHAIEYAEDFEWFICSNCLQEIGKRVAERSEVDIEIEVNGQNERDRS